MSAESLEELYRRTGALVLRRCRLILGEKEAEAEAEDIVQEVYIRVMRYDNSTRENQMPLSFLYRTAERCCFDRLKKRSREVTVSPAETEAWFFTKGDEQRHEAAQRVARFFHRLQPKLKQVALLHYVDGFSQEQIAEETGWSRRTVGKKVKKLHQMAERLEKALKGEDN